MIKKKAGRHTGRGCSMEGPGVHLSHELISQISCSYILFSLLFLALGTQVFSECGNSISPLTCCPGCPLLENLCGTLSVSRNTELPIVLMLI